VQYPHTKHCQELSGDTSRYLNAETGLAGATGTGQGDQPVVDEQLLQVSHLRAAADKAGELSQVAGARTIALAPLSDSETAALLSRLLGPDPSNGALGQTIAVPPSPRPARLAFSAAESATRAGSYRSRLLTPLAVHRFSFNRSGHSPFFRRCTVC
jgi:hypothetical protein